MYLFDEPDRRYHERNFYEIVEDLPRERHSKEISFNNKIRHPIPDLNEHWPDIEKDGVKQIPITFPFEEDHSLGSIDLKESDEKNNNSLIEEFGFEICAFYRSYHFENVHSSNWGIFIHQDCATKLSMKIYNTYKNKNLKITHQDAFFLALRKLFFHEYFHFLHDFAITKLEILYDKSLYIPYFNHIYLKTYPLAHEEAAANRYVYEQNKIEKGNKNKYMNLEVLKDILNKQPKAYSDWNEYIFDYQKDHLANMVLEMNSSPRNNKFLHHLYSEKSPCLSKKKIPVYLI